jgi:hypothetical protein
MHIHKYKCTRDSVTYHFLKQQQKTLCHTASIITRVMEPTTATTATASNERNDKQAIPKS